MNNSMSQIIIVRGKFYPDEHNKQLLMVEYNGFPMLLTPEPRIIINETANTNLSAFLKQHLTPGNTLTIHFVECDNIEELFDNQAIANKMTKTMIVGEYDVRYEKGNSEIIVNGESLYDTIWHFWNGQLEQYVYMEISVM